MFKYFVITAALLSTALQAAPGERTFTDGDRTFVYNVANDARGRIVLTGRDTSTEIPFRYIIDGRRVTGFTGGQPVSFTIAKPIAPAAILTAAR